MATVTVEAMPQVPVEERARRSLGISNTAIYELVARCIGRCHTGGGVLLDVGCGSGNLWRFVSRHFDRYVGADAARYDEFPADGRFIPVDLDNQRVGLADGAANVVAALEIIEHVENPRALMRELTRLCLPGGWLIVTTPNQLSLLSKLTLILKNQFNAFQDSCYPAHLTALLEVDLLRMATECGLVGIEFDYTGHGRVPGSKQHFPGWLSRMFPRAFSDNILLLGRKPFLPASRRNDLDRQGKIDP
ncbi:MAG: methyltransferase domain-containing protein [Planctomycetota bacterium]